MTLDQQPDYPRQKRGSLVRRLARLISTLVYREIDIAVDPRLGEGGLGGPVVAVSNHFGGLADAVLLVDASPRLPHIVARDVIWKVPIARSVMKGVGAIPVHRRADGAGGSNDQMFSSCYQSLAKGEMILIFPEGVTQDVPHMAEVKTGASRIALGARASGTKGVRIVPIGVHYEDKAVFRSRVLVNIGEPIDVDAWVAEWDGPAAADDHDAAHALTDLIDERVRAAAPNFPDWATAHTYTTAAEVPLYDVGDSSEPLRYGDTQLLAKRLQSVDDDKAVERAAGQYAASLAEARASDETVARKGKRRPVAEGESRWRDLLLSLILLPYAVVGVVIGFIPWLLVQAVRVIPAAPAVRATITPGIAAVAFGAEWIYATWRMSTDFGAQAGLGAFLLFPFFLAATVFVAERLSLFVQRLLSGRHPDPETMAALERQRSTLSSLIWERL